MALESRRRHATKKISAPTVAARLRRMQRELTALAEAWARRSPDVAWRIAERRSGGPLVQTRFNRVGLEIAELIPCFDATTPPKERSK